MTDWTSLLADAAARLVQHLAQTRLIDVPELSKRLGRPVLRKRGA